MLDELSVYARLDSPLYGSLVQATEIMSLAIDADTAAGRVFGSPIRGLGIHVSPKRLEAKEQQMPGLLTWPMDGDSIFELMRQRGMRDCSFRYGELPLHQGTQPGDLMRRVHRLRPVCDAIALSVSLPGDAWAALVLIRCGPRPPFSEQAMDTVNRFRPALSKRLSQGYYQEPASQPKSTPDQFERGRLSWGATQAQAPPQRMLSRLSETEREVLRHLREEKTERAIAGELHRSPHTIHVHVKSIYRKLAVSSRKELLRVLSDQATPVAG